MEDRESYEVIKTKKERRREKRERRLTQDIEEAGNIDDSADNIETQPTQNERIPERQYVQDDREVEMINDRIANNLKEVEHSSAKVDGKNTRIDDDRSTTRQCAQNDRVVERTNDRRIITIKEVEAIHPQASDVTQTISNTDSDEGKKSKKERRQEKSKRWWKIREHMENKRIANIANASRTNQDEYEESVHETAYWTRRETIEKKPYDPSTSARMKLKDIKEKTRRERVETSKEEAITRRKQTTTQMRVKESKEETKGDTGEGGKEVHKVIPKKQKTNMQMRVEEGKARDKGRRERIAMTKDRWLVQRLETIIERLDEDDDNEMNLAEQYEQWREKYSIADEEDDEVSRGDGKIGGTHRDGVESEGEESPVERWYRQFQENEEKKRKEEILIYKEVRKQEKRLRRTREKVREKEETTRGGGLRYFKEVTGTQGDSIGGEVTSSQSIDSNIPRTLKVHEKTGIEMLYWEEEIATWRTTKKGFVRGMFHIAFQIELKAVMDEIEIARQVIAGKDPIEEVKRTGEFMTRQKPVKRRKTTNKKGNGKTIIEVTTTSDSGKGINKKTMEKQKVKTCIKTSRPHREKGKRVRPTSSEYTVPTAEPHKDMGNPCAELMKGWYILKVTVWAVDEEKRGCWRKRVQGAGGTRRCEDRRLSRLDMTMCMFVDDVCTCVIMKNLLKVEIPGSLDHDNHAG